MSKHTTPRKTCSQCKKDKPLSEFHKQSNLKDGHRPACKTCTKRNDRKRRQKPQAERTKDCRYFSTQEILVRNVIPGKPNECWLWDGYIDGKGYGAYQWRGKVRRAHRLAYSLHYGKIPPGLHILHKCDNPRCVNPYHLWAGTHQDNMSDMAAKGRRKTGNVPRGSDHPQAKLTEENVREMRRLRSLNNTYISIGRQFGVTEQTAYDVCKRSWKHVK